jgi:hypothetical protein
MAAGEFSFDGPGVVRLQLMVGTVLEKLTKVERQGREADARSDTA